MKTIFVVMVAGFWAVSQVQAQDVLVLGPYSQQQPQSTVIVQQQPYPVYVPTPVPVPVAPSYAPVPSYDPYYYANYNPNVMYIGGPGSCGPNYYNNYYAYPRYPSPNVIYFGQWQGYREGYHFRHCR